MVSTAHNQLRVGHGIVDNLESLDHQLQSLIRSPLSESQNAVLRIAAPRKVGIFRPAGEHAMRAKMNIVASIFVLQNLAIARHEHRHGIRQQKRPGGERAGCPVCTRVAHPGVFEIDCIHQMVQSDVGIAAA
jgi:hypothetical protein